MEVKKKLIPFVVIVLLVAGIPAAWAGFVPGTGETTKIWLMDAADPTATPVTYPDGQQYVELNDTYELGDTFTVWANVTDVTELRGYAVGVTYDDSILECTSYSEGVFFYEVDEQYRDSPDTPDLADGSGELGYWNHVTWVLQKPGNISGTGLAAIFHFEVVGVGATLIDIIITGSKMAILADVTDHDLPFNTIDIIFDNTGLVEMHELTVSLEAPDIVKLGESSLLNATVENIGNTTETDVELQLLIDGTAVNSTTIATLLNGSSYTIDYRWTPDTEATYNITAYATPVLDESNTDNNVDTKLVTVPPSHWCISHPVVWDAVTYYVGTCSNATVSNLTFSQPDKQILFNFTAPSYEPTGYYWCNVTIPKVLLDAASEDRWELRSAGVPITEADRRIISSNDTHTFVYFVSWAAPTETTEVDITGTIVIPEFPAAMLLLLFVIATLVVIILRKTNQPKRKNISR